jgi:hypothetical protein
LSLSLKFLPWVLGPPTCYEMLRRASEADSLWTW